MTAHHNGRGVRATAPLERPTAGREVAALPATPTAGGLVGDAGTLPEPGGALLRPQVAGPDRWRTAHHEAGHACVRWACGLKVEAVSLRATETYNGATIIDVSELAALSPDDFGDGPIPMHPFEVRALIERHAMGALAGAIAGETAALLYDPAGWLPEPDPSAVAAALAALPPRSLELVAEAEARTEPGPSDEEQAAALVHLLALDADVEPLYLAWLQADLAALIRRQWPRITRLALALLERHYIDGVEAVAILRGDLAAVHQSAGTLPAK